MDVQWRNAIVRFVSLMRGLQEIMGGRKAVKKSVLRFVQLPRSKAVVDVNS
jgi:hypothetical protein